MKLVRCKVCSKINNKDKLSMFKLDFFIKHSCLNKCISTSRTRIKEGHEEKEICAICCNLASAQTRMSNDEF
jgi:hypothetical protein